LPGAGLQFQPALVGQVREDRLDGLVDRQAVGADVPAGTDGVSFLPQLRGEKGTPREWFPRTRSLRCR